MILRDGKPCRFRGRRVLRPYGLQTSCATRLDLQSSSGSWALRAWTASGGQRFRRWTTTGNVPARSIFPYCRIPLIPNQPWIIGENLMNTGANTMHTMLISLIRIFSAGPLVSLQGSPTVSPITAAP